LNVFLLERQCRFVNPILPTNDSAQNKTICVNRQILDHGAIPKLQVNCGVSMRQPPV
jgi:hypothetical protein